MQRNTGGDDTSAGWEGGVPATPARPVMFAPEYVTGSIQSLSATFLRRDFPEPF